MVFRLEEAVAAVAAPDVRCDGAALRTSAALFDGNRYFMYATGALVVVLVENQDAATPLNPRSEARRPSQFDLWQVWTCDDVVRCIRFNSSRKAARGAIALCVDEGRGVLLMPCGAGAASKPTATGASYTSAAAATTASNSKASDSKSVGVSSLSSSVSASGHAGDVTSEYAKVHLHLQMTTWRESVRWKSEDRLMDRLEWVETGADDLLLVGAGEKITIWKLVDDAVQVYLQRSFSLRCGADRSVRHFDATSGAGRFLATAAAHDRVVKVWHLDAFGHDGAPLCQFLAHQRAVEHVQWSKDSHTFKLRAPSTSGSAAHCEMLFTLERAGTVSIWRENVATRSFVLWKLFSGQDYLSQPESERFFFDADRSTNTMIRTLGLVSHAWARPTASTLASIPDAMLDETNVLAALAMFHYGYSSLDDARRSELYSQRMDGSGKMHGKLLGDKCGATADTHAGETFICGNAPLHKTFAVHLLYGVHDNGDLCLFRTEFIPFSGVTPKVSLLLIFNGLRAQLVNATIVSICSSDYRDRENGSSTFVIEIVFQSRSNETHVRVARLKLQADSASFSGARGTRGSVCYSVQSCEVGDLCDCVFGAPQLDGTSRSLAISKVRAAKRVAPPPLNSASATDVSLKVAVSNIDGRIDIFRPSASLRKLQIVCRPHPSAAMREATHTCCFEEQSVLFFFANGKLQAATTASDSESPHQSASATSATGALLPPLLGGSSARSASLQVGSQSSAAASTHAIMCFEDESEDCSDESVELDALVLVRVPETLKREWSSSSHSIFGSSPSSSSSASKDYCVVLGLKRGGAEVLVWVFSFEPLSSPTASPQAAAECSDDVQDDDLRLDSPPSPQRPRAPVSMKLHRKARVAAPRSRFVCLSSVPSIEPFELIFATIDAQFQLDVWTFADFDDLTELKNVQRTDVRALIKAATAQEKPADAMSFHVVDETLVFKQFALSACGRVAVLFERTEARLNAPTQQSSSAVDAHLCVLPLLESCAEGVVVLEHKKLGAIVSLEWTPPVTPERACELLFLSTTAIGVVTCDASLPTAKWSITWSSSRFSVKPQRISSLTSYPHALLALEASVASVNLHDLSGATTAGTHCGLPFRISQSPELPSAAQSLQPRPSAVFGAHHPATLMFLLLRGSFRSLETVLAHVKTSMLEHEKTCYLRMMDDAPLTELPLLSLVKLLGESAGDSDAQSGTDQADDERSAVYLNGKQSSSSGFGSSSSTSAAPPARASDLFAMDYRSSRSNLDRAEMLFAPRSALGLSSAVDSTEDGAASMTAAAATQTLLTDAAFAAFFSDHRAHLTFLSPEEADVFLSIVQGMRKTVAWERDNSRKKDAAALRFHASLLWPLQPTSERDTSAPKKTNSANGSTGAAESEPSGADDSDDAVSESRAVGICSEQVVWAAITDCQDELLQECFPTPTMTWREMQQLRLPFWVKSVAKLQQFTEKAAQSEYATTRDPFHVALFYVLLGKTKLLASLFKMSNETRIYELLSNDFADPRWKTAAIKNAYVLKAKRRYELSTAFFLLGGKVQEAMAVAEHADRTLVLSFLIARLSERWDLGGESNDSASSSDFGQFSVSGLSSSMRSSLAGVAGMPSMAGTADASGCKGVSVEYLKTAVWTRAEMSGDVYMRFLVKYLAGETQSGIQCLLTVPTVEMRCMFGTCGNAYAYPYTLYWRAFGQSMLGACEIVRFLERTIVPLKVSVKTQIVRLQTLALSRVHAMGLHTAALVQQRDFASFAVQFARDKPHSPEAAALLACRHQILIAALGAQVDALYAAFLARVRDSMIGKSASSAQARPELETGINDEIRCLVTRGGAFALDAVVETAHTHVEGMLRSSVVQSLVHSCRLAGLDFLVSGWRALADTEPAQMLLPQCTSPLPHFIDVISDGIALVASGDLIASSTDQLHTRRVDQTCSQLLAASSRLLLWLSYYYSKASEQRLCITSSEYVRVAAAAIYSVICVCARYLRSPCCLYRALGVIFPHKDALPKKVLDELREIALADVCVYCAAARSASRTAAATTTTSPSSLQQDIPALYLVVEMLQNELDALVADVKTNRLQLAAATSSFFTYCQYWTLVLMMSASGMPAHVTKIAVDGAHPMSDSTIAAKKLVQVWSAYNTRLAKYGARKLLCDLAALYFRPFDVASANGSSASNSSSNGVSAGGDAKGSASTASLSVSTSSPSASGTSSLSSSPTKKDSGSRDPRRLLGCSCTRCPWLLLVKLFAEKDEFLLRLHAQLECCSEKIKNEISWGHLPDFPSKKAVLTRSQKILLSTAAGTGKNPGTPRAADLVDLFEKRMQTQAPVVLQTSCIYRSEVSIKSMCFNRATETAEMILCSSKGICRTGCADYSDGSKFQFKGMYANPQASFFSDATSLPMAPMRRKTTADTVGNSASANADLTAAIGPPLSIGSRMLAGGSPSPSSLLSSASASPSDSKVPSFKPTAVESHPFLPLFASGNQKGKVHLWSYDSLSAVCSFQVDDVVAPYPSSPSLSSRRDVKKIKFDNLGQQMGAVDTLGRLFMWKFSSLDRETCYRQIECHDKGAKALTFINAASCVATVGSSTEKKSVCMWDLLLPTSKALVAAPVCHPAGAASVAFSSTHQLLISGGEGGSISVFDVRQRRVLHTVTNAHETAITTLELHPSGHCVLSGSASGDVKIWSLPIFREITALSKVHAKPSFLGDAASNILGDAASNMAINVTSSSWGVTDAVATDDYFFTSGTDGSVQRMRVPSLSKLF